MAYHQETDPLFLGMTRPPMAFGVTYTFLLLNGMTTAILFLATHSLSIWLVGIPIHIVGYLACIKDPRIFELWRVKLLQTPPNRNRHHWKSNSYRP